MPLISLCGLPCSGKTTRALEIAAGLKDIMPVHIINDASLGLDRSIYDGGQSVFPLSPPPRILTTAAPMTASVGEKRARGAILSAVERLLSKQVVVIVDGMNYVKGFRYQLFCLARAMTTHHCVVYCGVSGDIARAWNEARSAKDAYPAEQYVSCPFHNGHHKDHT
jgi:protein KTI12